MRPSATDSGMRARSSNACRVEPRDLRANAGYHIVGGYAAPDGSSASWVNIRSRARGLLALFLFTDVGNF